MPRKDRKKCCICLSGKSSRFHATSGKEKNIESCFGCKREGLLCNSCVSRLNSFQLGDFSVCHFSHVVDQKGKRGRPKPIKNYTKSNLENLSEELIVNILILLDTRDVISTMCTSKYMHCKLSKNIVWRPLFRRDFGHLVDFGSENTEYNWLHFYQLMNIISKDIYRAKSTSSEAISSLLKISQLNYQDKETAQLQLKHAVQSLESLSSVNIQQPLTWEQEVLFRQIVHHKEVNSADNLIRAHNVRGRPRALLPIKLAETDSQNACSSTVRARSKDAEKFQELLCANKSTNNTSKEEANIKQQESLIRRNKARYMVALQNSGIKVLAKFSKETVLAIKSQVPFNMWRMLKRAFRLETNEDVFGSEKSLRNDLRELHFEYECGNVEICISNEIKNVHFLRVTNISEVIKQTVHQLVDAKLMSTVNPKIPHNLVKCFITGDKGGSSTKLYLQILNTAHHNSTKLGKLLGMFEGGKDNRECIELVFSPIFEKLKEIAGDISYMELKTPLCHGAQTSASSRDKDESSQMQTGLNSNNKYPLQPFDNSNFYKSASCKVCDNDESEPQCDSDSCSSLYQKLDCVHGGDWEWEARILGLTGPNGKHFCSFCLADLSSLEKGYPHSPVILKKEKNGQQIYTSTKPKHEFPMRTLEGMKADYERFVADGGKKGKVSEFNNCEYQPLIGDYGCVLEKVSVMPLHIGLGIGLKIVNIIEEKAIQLDIQIRDAEGIISDEVRQMYAEKFDLLAMLVVAEEDEEKTVGDLEEMKEQYSDIENANQTYMEKQHGKFKDSSKLAKEGRQKVKNMKKTVKEFEEKLKQARILIETTQNNLDELCKKLEEVKGPFQTKFDKVMSDLSLQRKVYHKGALNGNDIYTVFQPANLKHFSDIFKPLAITVANSEDLLTFSSHEICQLIYTLLHKFELCYRLFSLNRPLCKHEVESLAIRCYSFGCWFPVNFPEESLPRKFHVLTHHIPQKARLSYTVGIETEQGIESIHPFVNKWNRTFASLQNPCERLTQVMKMQWLHSKPTLTNFIKPIPRKGN